MKYHVRCVKVVVRLSRWNEAFAIKGAWKRGSGDVREMMVEKNPEDLYLTRWDFLDIFPSISFLFSFFLSLSVENGN